MRHADTLIAFTAGAVAGFALGRMGCAWQLVRTDPDPPTPTQETALAHMRDRYPELANHTDPALEAFEALARVAAQTQHDPRSVDRTTQEHALRLVDLAKQDPRS